jgi:RimJ/RimL family protein N-acetyltransferase
MIVKELLKRAKGKYEIVTANTFSRNIASKKLLKKTRLREVGIRPKVCQAWQIIHGYGIILSEIKKWPKMTN